MKKWALIFLTSISSIQFTSAKIYECIYKTKTGLIATSSFNTLHLSHPNYATLSFALKNGNRKELYVKKYFIDAISCNIQFYKYNMKIANVTCAQNRESALTKIKAIARKDFGYLGN